MNGLIVNKSSANPIRKTIKPPDKMIFNISMSPRFPLLKNPCRHRELIMNPRNIPIPPILFILEILFCL